MDSRNMGNFANKAIFLAGIALLFVCPHHAFGQTTLTTTDTPATVNISTGETINLTPSTVVAGSTLAFGDAEHTLTITDGGNAGTIASLGNITTVSGGSGMLVFNLRSTGTTLTVGQIGTANRRVASINVQNSNQGSPIGGSLTVGDVFAGTLNVSRNQTLTAEAINVDTLTNNGTLTANDAISAKTLTNTNFGNLTSTEIDAETLTNSGTLNAGTVDAGTLTNSGNLTATGVITATTLTNNRTLTADKITAKTLTNSTSGTLTIGDTINVGALTNNGNLTINGTGNSTVDTLGGSGNITSSGDLTIGNMAPGGFSGSITSAELTVRQGSFLGDISTSGNFTANLNGNLYVTKTLTVGGDADFRGNGRAELGTVKVAGTTTITDNATVALDITSSTFPNGITATGNGMLVVYGESLDPRTIPFDGTDRNFKNIAIFTDWQLVGKNIENTVGTGIRSQAYMNDGYLAAFTMHNRYTAWNMVHDRLISGNSNDHCKSAWFNYIGRSHTYNSSFNHRNWKTFTHGGQIGGDFLKTPRFQSGLLFGYEGSQSKNEDDQLETSDIYFGLYGVFLFRNGADARIVFAQGWQDYDLDRMGNNNVLYTSSFKGGTSEANFELGKRIGSGPCSLRPVLAVDVYNNNLNETRESGIGSERVIYGKTKFTQVFFRTGMDLRHRTKEYTINSGIYYAYDTNGAELRTRVTSANDPTLSAPLIGTKLGSSLLMFNLGAEGEISTNFSLFLGYTGEYVMDSSKDALHSIASVGFFGKW